MDCFGDCFTASREVAFCCSSTHVDPAYVYSTVSPYRQVTLPEWLTGSPANSQAVGLCPRVFESLR